MPEKPLTPKLLRSLLQRSCNNTDISTCRHLHNRIIELGYLSDAYLPNYLIRMYAGCGLLPDACNVFCRIPDPTVFSWSAIISACARHGLHQQAFEFYSQSLRSKAQPDGHVYAAMLAACARKAEFGHGKLIHAHVLASPYKQDIFVNNSLIDMYAKCGSLCMAQQVFDGLASRDIVTWNTLIAGYVQNESWDAALLLFVRLQHTGLQPNHITLVCVLKACASMPAFSDGVACHFLAAEQGLELVLHVNNVLIDLYAKSGSLYDAEMLFSKSSKQDVVTWTSIIGGFVDHGFGEKAIEFYERMQKNCIEPNEVTYASVLKGCSSLLAFDLGRLVHAITVERGLMWSVLINNSLIGMYAICGSLDDATRVFEKSWKRDVVTWNSMIVGYVEHGHAYFALKLFKQMQQEGLELDSLALASAIRACAHLRHAHEGKVAHLLSLASGWSGISCVNNNLIHMYASCSSLYEARRVFDGACKHDVVTWNAMIGGYVLCGRGEEALKLFDRMQHYAAEPNPITFLCAIKACSLTLALDKGRLLHAEILRRNFELDAYLGSVLIIFYTRCKCAQDAHTVFSRLQNRDVVPWSAMVAGYAQHSHFGEALTCVKDMEEQGLELDDVVYVSLLSAFGHAGVLHEGLIGGEWASLKMYNCLADLLGRAGHLKQAKSVIENMPFAPDALSLNSLLSHCRTHGYLEPENYLNKESKQ